VIRSGAIEAGYGLLRIARLRIIAGSGCVRIRRKQDRLIAADRGTIEQITRKPLRCPPDCSPAESLRVV
jgi:hypothetical protein